MRQRLYVNVLTSVDVDEWMPDQGNHEAALEKAVIKAVQELTGDDDVMVELDYDESI